MRYRSLVLYFASGVLFTNVAAAKETWLCTEEASQRAGNAIKACGIGIGNDENVARAKAFDSAKTEFGKICDASDDCKGHRISVQPERTTCERSENSKSPYKCYRLLVFTIGASVNRETAFIPPSGARSSTNINDTDTPDIFEPFTYEKIKSLPKIKKGMSKTDLLQQFGAPIKAETESDGNLTLVYGGRMCDGQFCSVYLDKNGHVQGYRDFSYQYTEALK